MNHSDAELLIRSRTEPEAIGIIYDRHAPAVHAYLARRVDKVVVDDLLSEVFVAAVGARRRVRPHASGSALPWLYGIAHNVVRTHRRRPPQSFKILKTAATAAGLRSASLGEAPYWKVVTQYGSDESSRTTRWMGVDGPGVMPFDDGAEGPGDSGLFMDMPQATIRLDGRTYTWRELNNGALAAEDLPRLLTESELKHRDTDPDRAAHEYYFFKEAYEVLARTPASPAIREALWEAVADIKGVELDGEVTDSLGRTGWAVTLKGLGMGAQTYIVDPTSGALLETRGHAEGRRNRAPRPKFFNISPATTIDLLARTNSKQPGRPSGRLARWVRRLVGSWFVVDGVVVRRGGW